METDSPRYSYLKTQLDCHQNISRILTLVKSETSFIWNMSQKVSAPRPSPIPSTPSSMLRAAFERLSFRSRRRKKEIKYDLVIEQRQKLDADKSDPDFDLVTEEETVQNNKFQDSKDLIT